MVCQGNRSVNARDLALIREALGDRAENAALEDVASLLLRLPKTGLVGWKAIERYLDTLYLHLGDPVYMLA